MAGLRSWIFFTIGALGCIYIFIKYRLAHWKRVGILHVRPAFLWGNIKSVAKRRMHIRTLMQNVYEEYKGEAPFIGFYVYIKPLLVTFEESLVREVLQPNSEIFLPLNLLKPVTDNCIIDNQVPSGNSQIRNGLPVGIVHELFPKLLEAAVTFQRTLLEKQKIQANFIINDLIECYNLDVISLVAFGLHGDTLRYNATEFRQMSRYLISKCSLLDTYYALDFPCLAKLLQCDNSTNLAIKYFYNLAKTKLDERQTLCSGDKRNAAVNDLLTVLQNGAAPLSNRDIAVCAIDFSAECLQLSNSIMTFCLHELAMHLDVQDRARAEIKALLSKNNGAINIESLNDCHYLRQILKETLRLHSPFPFLLWKCAKNFEIDNTVFMLAKDNDIMVPIAAINRDPLLYASPERFNPERFATFTKEEECPTAPSLPLGINQHAYLSWFFIESQIIVGLLTILQHYRCLPCVNTPQRLKYAENRILLATSDNIMLTLETT